MGLRVRFEGKPALPTLVGCGAAWSIQSCARVRNPVPVVPVPVVVIVATATIPADAEGGWQAAVAATVRMATAIPDVGAVRQAP